MASSNASKRLVRFENPQGQTRLGQPVDPAVDVGLAVAAGEKVEVHLIKRGLYDGTVTSEKDTIKKVRLRSLVCILTLQLLSPLTGQECSIIRCLGLNYKST